MNLKSTAMSIIFIYKSKIYNIIKCILFIIIIYTLIKITTASNIEDPFGFCLRRIKIDYYLVCLDDIYYVNKGKFIKSGAGAFDGTVDKIKIEDSYIYAIVDRCSNGDKDGIYRINLKTDSIEGPFIIDDKSKFISADELFNSLYWIP